MQAFLKHLANVVYSKIVLPLTLSKGLGVAHDPAKGRYQTED